MANPNIKIKLIDVPEMNFFVSDKPFPRGEICVKSPYMADGYYGDQQLTNESFKDGWFCTGDIGILEKDGKITIIDRKKNIFKVNFLGNFFITKNFVVISRRIRCTRKY